VGLLRARLRAILARPERLELVRRQLSSVGPLLPHTPGEHRGFAVLSITAGICEEILFRGFVMWYLGVWSGPVLAAVISSVLFGFAHIYLGLHHALRAGIVGAVMSLIVLALGSLSAPMIIHAAV